MTALLVGPSMLSTPPRNRTGLKPDLSGFGRAPKRFLLSLDSRFRLTVLPGVLSSILGFGSGRDDSASEIDGGIDEVSSGGRKDGTRRLLTSNEVTNLS